MDRPLRRSFSWCQIDRRSRSLEETLSALQTRIAKGEQPNGLRHIISLIKFPWCVTVTFMALDACSLQA